MKNTETDMNIKDSCVQVHHERKTSRLPPRPEQCWNCSEHQAFICSSSPRTSRVWCDSHLGLNSAGTDSNVKDPDFRVHREQETSRLWRGSHLGLNNAGIVLNIIIPRRGDAGEMIALTLGGARILFTCMAATLCLIGLVLLCCLCLCAITCHPSQMILHQ